ncbi:MAG: hypothetical protein A3I66_15020 [Burkholderiales bacterium RIFCSPLOWO2_02_FULL_57_36]|nr:MAG: hypothetical protein A3I66_15020 [Burkholderiales bacterium RIFCSPLOWO2_02_FULL_57_36]
MGAEDFSAPALLTQPSLIIRKKFHIGDKSKRHCGFSILCRSDISYFLNGAEPTGSRGMSGGLPFCIGSM